MNMHKAHFLFLLGLFSWQANAQTINRIRNDAQGRPDIIIVADPGPRSDSPWHRSIFVEQMPEFRGDINSYIKEHFIYPKGGDCFTGRVVVQFVVSESGALKDIQIVRSCGRRSFDQAVLEMMTKMPAWKPGKQHGVPVNAIYALPILIDLE